MMSTREVDVVVVGGGIAGVSAAYFLAARGQRVLLAEAEDTLAYHTTGRSAAVSIRFYGQPSTQRLTAFGTPWLRDPPSELADAPVLRSRGLMLVGAIEGVAAFHASVADRYREIEMIDAVEAARRVPVLRADAFDAAVVDRTVHDIDVAGLHQAYVRGLLAAGGAIERGARLETFRRTDDGWAAESSELLVRAHAIVNAAGAWADVVASHAGVEPLGIEPRRRSAFLVKAPAGTDHSGWPLVSDLDETWYFEPEGPHLLCSPADQTPSEPCDARPEELDIALGIERINAMTTLDIRALHTTWAGLRTFAADEAYVIGEDPTAPGFYWLVGQGGSGIQTSAGAGQLIASLVTGDGVPDGLAALGFDQASVAPDRLRGDQPATAEPSTSSGFTGSKKATS